MSIATKRGDGGQTGLAGGIRVSKSSLRVEAYGTVDELNSVLGIARSQCKDDDLRACTKSIQRELFRVGSGLATPAESRKPQVPITDELVEGLTGQVHEIEAMEGLLSDWSLPGGHPAGAFYDHARTVCRRAERCVVRLMPGEERNNMRQRPRRVALIEAGRIVYTSDSYGAVTYNVLDRVFGVCAGRLQGTSEHPISVFRRELGVP